MRPRLIVADFDGTAVDSTLVIDQSVPGLVNELKSRGILFSFATGRPFKGILQSICNTLNLSGPQIILNGAEIVNAGGGNTLWSSLMDWEKAAPLVSFLKLSSQPFRIECDDAIYFGNRPLPKQDSSSLQLLSINNLRPRPIAKILIEPSSSGSLEKIESEIKSSFSDLSIMRNRLRPQVEDLNVTAPGVNKYFAVLQLGKILNISPNEIAAIGDSEVDAPLLEGAMIKAAIKGSEKLEQLADFTVPSPPAGFPIFLRRILSNTL